MSVDIEGSDDENVGPPSARQRTSSRSSKSVRKDVAATLHMNKVSPRAIAYAAVQVRRRHHVLLSSGPSANKFGSCYSH